MMAARLGARCAMVAKVRQLSQVAWHNINECILSSDHSKDV